MIAETLFHHIRAPPPTLLPQRLLRSDQSPRISGHPGYENMAAIPQTLQLTKAAQKQKCGGWNSASTDSYFNMAENDQPARYNSKLMNSIWGRYNENSVHNFKSLQCGGMGAAGGQATYEVGQTLLQPSSTPLTSSNMKRCLRELGEAVSTNFMDNLNQY